VNVAVAVAVAVIAPVGVAALGSGNEAVAVINAVDEARNHKGSVDIAGTPH
jgi:hypothetical protein